MLFVFEKGDGRIFQNNYWYYRLVSSFDKMVVIPLNPLFRIITKSCMLASVSVWQFVCVSGCKITHNSRTPWHIFTKFLPLVYLGFVQNSFNLQNRQMKILGKM